MVKITATITGRQYHEHDIVQLSTGEKLVVYERKVKQVIAFPYREWYETKKVQNIASIIFAGFVGVSVCACMVAFTVTSVGIIVSASLVSALVVASLGLFLVRCFNNNDYVDPEVKYAARRSAVSTPRSLVRAEENLVTVEEKRKAVADLYVKEGITLANLQDVAAMLQYLQGKKIIPTKKAVEAYFCQDNARDLQALDRHKEGAGYEDALLYHFIEGANNSFRKYYMRKYPSWNKDVDYANVPGNVQAAILAAYSVQMITERQLIG